MKYGLTGLLTVLLMVSAKFLLPAGCIQDCEQSGELTGTNWILVAWPVSSQNPADFTITAEFTDNHISGIAALNRYSGPYVASGNGGFRIAELAVTEMAGPPEVMQAESTYLNLLLSARKYSRFEKTLTLYDERNNEVLIFEEK